MTYEEFLAIAKEQNVPEAMLIEMGRGRPVLTAENHREVRIWEEAWLTLSRGELCELLGEIRRDWVLHRLNNTKLQPLGAGYEGTFDKMTGTVIGRGRGKIFQVSRDMALAVARLFPPLGLAKEIRVGTEFNVTEPTLIAFEQDAELLVSGKYVLPLGPFEQFLLLPGMWVRLHAVTHGQEVTMMHERTGITPKECIDWYANDMKHDHKMAYSTSFPIEQVFQYDHSAQARADLTTLADVLDRKNL